MHTNGQNAGVTLIKDDRGTTLPHGDYIQVGKRQHNLPGTEATEGRSAFLKAVQYNFLKMKLEEASAANAACSAAC